MGRRIPGSSAPGGESPATRLSAWNDRSQSARVQGDLGPVDNRQAAAARRHRGLHSRVHAVDVENSESIQAQARSLRDHIRRLVGALQEGERTVSVQLGVSGFIDHSSIVSNICSITLC